MVGRQALALLIEVRFLVPEPFVCVMNALFDNRIVDDAFYFGARIVLR